MERRGTNVSPRSKKSTQPKRNTIKTRSQVKLAILPLVELDTIEKSSDDVRKWEKVPKNKWKIYTPRDRTCFF